MKRITFRLNLCALTDKNYSERIMIYKPFETHAFSLSFATIYDATVVDIIKTAKEKLSNYLRGIGESNLKLSTVFLNTANTLLGFRENKKLSELFEIFQKDELRFEYFVHVGGASIHCFGYRFTIHPNESIHRNKPHVHVCKNGSSVRYSLETFERFTNDKAPKEYLRDEKKSSFRS